MSQLMKSIELLRVLIKNPREFQDRVFTIVEARRDALQTRQVTYNVRDPDRGLTLIESILGSGLGARFHERPLLEIAEHVRERSGQMPPEAPFGLFHNGDALLGRVCYAVVRALRPSVVVETGVCHGVTSAFLLKALEMNKAGVLHSVDLPPLGKHGDRYVGWMIPEELRSRWTLRRGTTRRLLRPLLADVGHIDLFIHDSLHTYRNMRAEFAAAWVALRPGGMLISDDIEGNCAFQELAERPDVSVSAVVKQEDNDSLLGIAVKTNGGSAEGGNYLKTHSNAHDYKQP